MAERLFYCGIAVPDSVVGRATELWLTGERQNINRAIESVADKMVSEVPLRLQDLLDIATYIFVADRNTSRGDMTFPNMGAAWRRNFRLVIGVREPEFWSQPECLASLEELVGFLSDDIYTFNFVKLAELQTTSNKLPLTSDRRNASRQDQVVLFSGGLDSLAGAVEELTDTDDRIVLVSHRSSNSMFHCQNELATSLAKRFPDRVLYAPVEVTIKTGSDLRDVEQTQRTRTFLYATLGTVFAQMLGCHRIRFFENGVISFNLPIAAQVVGSRATRSTHPLAIHLMNRFFRNVCDFSFEVSNPYLWLTKAEVIKKIVQRGQKHLIASTISCTQVRFKESKPHCGGCSQCIHRRLGMIAANASDAEDTNNYEIELLTGDRIEGRSRTLAISLVDMALRYSRFTVTGFRDEFGAEVLRAARGSPDLSTEEFEQRTFDLHQRFGKETENVIECAIRQHAPEIRAHTLPPGSLLRAIVLDDQLKLDREAIDHTSIYEDVDLDVDDPDVRDYDRTSQILIGLDGDRSRILIDGLGEVGTKGDYDLLRPLIKTSREDRIVGIHPKDYPFVSKSDLMDVLEIDNEQALNKRISNFRRRLRKLALSRWGLPLGQGSVIETKRNTGVRINPVVVIVEASQLR